VDATIKRDPYCRCSVVGPFHSTEGAGSYQPRPTAWVLSAKRTQGLKGPDSSASCQENGLSARLSKTQVCARAHTWGTPS
jgi:hypothetical protein